MIDLLEDIHSALDAKAHLLALMGALAIPDICGAMESGDGEASAPRYILWFDKYVAYRYQGFLDGAQCYKFRCSLLHQATTGHPRSDYKRIIFLEPGGRMTMHKNILGDALNLDLHQFCIDLTSSAHNWLATVKGTEPYETHAVRLIRRYPNGLRPYIVGAAVIG